MPLNEISRSLLIVKKKNEKLLKRLRSYKVCLKPTHRKLR